MKCQILTQRLLLFKLWLMSFVSNNLRVVWVAMTFLSGTHYRGNSYCVCKYKNLIILRGFVNVTSMPLEKDYVKFCWLYLEDQRNGSNTFCVKLVIDFLRVKYLWAAWMRLQKILVKFGSGAMICGLFIFFVVINNSTNSSSKVEDIFNKSM